MCSGASCDAEKFVKYLQDEFDAGECYYPGLTYKVESGAQSTIIMAGVIVLNLIQVLKQHAYTYSYWQEGIGFNWINNTTALFYYYVLEQAKASL
jgi:hypothetical protein